MLWFTSHVVFVAHVALSLMLFVTSGPLGTKLKFPLIGQVQGTCTWGWHKFKHHGIPLAANVTRAQSRPRPTSQWPQINVAPIRATCDAVPTQGRVGAARFLNGSFNSKTDAGTSDSTIHAFLRSQATHHYCLVDVLFVGGSLFL